MQKVVNCSCTLRFEPGAMCAISRGNYWFCVCFKIFIVKKSLVNWLQCAKLYIQYKLFDLKPTFFFFFFWWKRWLIFIKVWGKNPWAGRVELFIKRGPLNIYKLEGWGQEKGRFQKTFHTLKRTYRITPALPFSC